MFWFWGTFVSLIKKASPNILNRSLGFLEAIKKKVSLDTTTSVSLHVYTTSACNATNAFEKRMHKGMCFYLIYHIIMCEDVCLCV